ncbi:MAG TPA: type II secretion system protein GspM [Burkholderiales bacterium]|nr:type II secretion system protein GspM [Burkholderiales bacterium]
MNAYVAALSTRFDQLAPRERVLVALGVIGVLGYAYSALLLQPALTERARVTKEAAALQAQVKTLDETLAAHGASGSSATQRAYRDGLRGQIAALDRQMRGMQRTLVAPSEMPSLLRKVLAHNRQLRLVSLHNQPVQRLEPPGASTAPERAQPAAAQRVIYRHTVEIRLTGSYADLHAYLAELERMPWQMYWGRLEVEAKDYPRLVATLTVHTLSLDKAWLTV